ncbi:MAG: pentapeptide repeat-containing protein [Bacteroidales bacterium]|jgi:uncharacterized protein YjbI with pentapeptide repeats
MTQMETKMIGNKIADARKKLSLSQAQLAEKLFISAQAVGKWERGESMPDILTLNKIADILNIDLNYFSETFSSTEIEIKSDAENTKKDKQTKKLSWDMSSGNWIDANFSGLKNLKEKFSSSNMKNCKFIGSELSGLILKNNQIDNCDFSNSDISLSNVQSSYFVKNDFKNCSLKESEFTISHLKGCDFTNTDFTGAKFNSSDFENNTIDNSKWNQTAFIKTSFDNVVFGGVLDNCSFENCGFKKVKFQKATLVNTFFKHNKKLKQVKFIDCKIDKLTYAFLKSGKADLTGITLIDNQD